MSRDLSTTLKKIEAKLKQAGITLSAEEEDALSNTIDMMEPYGGDPADAIQDRSPQMLRCGNCKHVWEGPYTPQELERFAYASMRLCICPRCLNNEAVFITQEKCNPVLTYETTIDEEYYPGYWGNICKDESGHNFGFEITNEPDMGTSGTFVRLQSWCKEKPPTHPELEALMGKRVRVTVEVIPDSAE